MMTILQYPETSSGDDVEIAAGISFADPYRWLETDNDVVCGWQRAQNRLSEGYVRNWPHFPALQASVAHYFVDRINGLPRHVAGKWFRMEQRTGPAGPRIVVSALPFGSGHDIGIPSAEDYENSLVLSWMSPSPDARIVAVGVCSDGSESNRILLIDVASGELLPGAPPQVLMDAWMGGVCWLPDSTGFYFLALEGDRHKFKQIVVLHDLESGRQVPAEIPLPDPTSLGYTLVIPCRDGRYLAAIHGLHAPRPVAIRDLSETNSKWRPFITQVDGTVSGFIRGDKFIAITDIGAPQGRIVAIALDTENPNATEQWSELLAESDFVLRSVKPIGDYLYVSGFVDAYSQVLILDQDGNSIGKVCLPGKGAIVEPLYPLMNSIPAGHPDEYYFVFSTLTDSWGVYRHRCDTQLVETVRAPLVHIDNAIVEDHWAVSADGVRIPYHTVRLAGVAHDGPAPSLLYAYGGFNIALLPEYPGAMTAFIAAGGIYIHGHIRGGAELGLRWWHAGRLKNKQNCYLDLYAIAEDVIKKGWTRPEKLAMTGRSNGGLMAAVAATQRPELWRAIVAQVPITDLIGLLRDAYGRNALANEYGDPNDPHEIARIASFSPYHLVDAGIEYPAIFIEAGATDQRCPAWHARKFAARLQAANRTNKFPLLLRVRDNAGHGFATAKKIQQCGYTEWIAFLMKELGMVPSCNTPGSSTFPENYRTDRV